MPPGPRPAYSSRRELSGTQRGSTPPLPQPPPWTSPRHPRLPAAPCPPGVSPSAAAILAARCTRVPTSPGKTLTEFKTHFLCLSPPLGSLPDTGARRQVRPSSTAIQTPLSQRRLTLPRASTTTREAHAVPAQVRLTLCSPKPCRSFTCLFIQQYLPPARSERGTVRNRHWGHRREKSKGRRPLGTDTLVRAGDLG